MKYGISGAALPESFPYASEITQACDEHDFPPCLAGAIKMNETGASIGETDIVSFDGGHGLFQLTSYVPADWSDPLGNARCAVEHYLAPALLHFSRLNFVGDDLIRLVAATFNAGYGGAVSGHNEGDCDKYTTGHYAGRALAHFNSLIEGKIA